MISDLEGYTLVIGGFLMAAAFIIEIARNA